MVFVYRCMRHAAQRPRLLPIRQHTFYSKAFENAPTFHADLVQSEQMLNNVLKRLQSSEIMTQMEEIAKLDILKETLLKWSSITGLERKLYLEQMPNSLLQECENKYGSNKIAYFLFKNNIGNVSANDRVNGYRLSLLVNEINAYAAENCFQGISVNKIPRLRTPAATTNDDSVKELFTDEYLKDIYIKVIDLLQTKEFKQKIVDLRKGHDMSDDLFDSMEAIGSVIFYAQLQVLEAQNQYKDMKEFIQDWVNLRCALDEWIPRVCNNDPELIKLTGDSQNRILDLMSKKVLTKKVFLALCVIIGVILSLLLVYLMGSSSTTTTSSS